LAQAVASPFAATWCALHAHSAHWPRVREVHGRRRRLLMWFIFDALGIALGLLTWLLLAFADWVIVRHVIVTWFSSSKPSISWLPFTDVGVCLFVLYQCLLGLSWFSHFQAATTDPGTIKDHTAPTTLGSPRECTLCKGWKPPRAHHCKTCHRCIFRMDHHCPWINNCVGLANQKLFILFLGYTALSAVVTLIMLSTSGICWLWGQKSWSDAASPSSTAIICSGLVAVECLAAVLFVSDFLQEQIESITQNSTLVETYQRTHGERSTFYKHWEQIFGERWLFWPMPFSSHIPADYIEPAIPDEPDYAYGGGHASQEDNETLGIASDATEASGMWDADGARLRQRGVPSEGS